MENLQTRNVVQPFILLALFGAIVFYLVNVMNTQDWLWFRSTGITAEPTYIVIIDHGQKTKLMPGSPGFADLSAAIVDSLGEINNSDLVSIGLSSQTLIDYGSNSLVMEVYFDQPIRFHTQFRAGNPTQLLFPLQGRHAGEDYFFRGDRGKWWYGALRMGNPAPLYAALNQLGYSVSVAGPAS